jgi:hypothetical protein
VEKARLGGGKRVFDPPLPMVLDSAQPAPTSLGFPSAASAAGSGVKSRIARMTIEEKILAPRREDAKRTTPRPWLLFAAFRLGARTSSPGP